MTRVVLGVGPALLTLLALLAHVGVGRAQDAGVALGPRDAGAAMDAGASSLAISDAGIAATAADAAVTDGSLDAGIGDADASTASAEASDAGAAAAVAPEVRIVVKPTTVSRDDGASPDADLLGQVMRFLSAEQEPDQQPGQPAQSGNKEHAPARGELDRLLPDLPESGFSLFGLLVVLTILVVAMTFSRRAREALSPEGILPSVLAIVHGALQLSVLITLLAIASRLLPTELAPGGRFLLLAVAVAIGWSGRDVFSDVAAGVVLTFERRIKGGMWVSGKDFEGLVERRSLRAMWVRDGHGNRIAVPNRKVLGTTIAVQEAPGPIHEVSLRIRGAHVKGAIRQALREAAITSPWVRPETAPTIRQDGRDPDLWHVRAALLEMRFAASFEGDLLERAEDVIAMHADEAKAQAATEADDDWD